MFHLSHRDGLNHLRLLGIRSGEELQQLTPAEVRVRAVRLLDDPQREKWGVPGSVSIERKRCGKARCRCRRGQLHGPYILWRARLLGVAIKRALAPADAERVRGLCNRYRAHHSRANTELAAALAMLAR